MHLGAQRTGDLPEHLQELFYFVPMQLAHGLQRAGNYEAALAWYRTVYAYSTVDVPNLLYPIDERKIFHGLAVEWNNAPNLSRKSTG
jgi:hypothetical protein